MQVAKASGQGVNGEHLAPPHVTNNATKIINHDESKFIFSENNNKEKNKKQREIKTETALFLIWKQQWNGYAIHLNA